MSESPPSAAMAKLGAEAGWCATCSHAKLNETRRGTAYLRCLRAEWDERMIRYPRLPVQDCPGFDSADVSPRDVQWPSDSPQR